MYNYIKPWVLCNTVRKETLVSWEKHKMSRKIGWGSANAASSFKQKLGILLSIEVVYLSHFDKSKAHFSVYFRIIYISITLGGFSFRLGVMFRLESYKYVTLGE